MLIEELWSNLIKILSDFADQVISLMPNLISATIILIIGYIVGKFVYSLVRLFLMKVIGLDTWLSRKGLSDAVYGISVSNFISGLVKWYIYFIFIWEAVSLLNVPLITEFIGSFVAYFPRVIGTALTVFLGLIIGEWLKQRVLETKLLPLKEQISSAVKISTVFVFLITGLHVAGLNITFLYQLILVITAALFLTFSLIFGISIGLALKDEIRPYIRGIFEELKKS